MSLNVIALQGRLTKDVELRYTQSQKPVASFTLAVDRADKTTDFIDIVAWNKTAEFASQYLQKGSMVLVQGRLQIRDWTDKNGNKRKTAEVVADHVYFGESKKDGFTPAEKPVSVSAFTELEDEDPKLPF